MESDGASHMTIAADTFCNVCDQCPADTIYNAQPMCYVCRENSAQAAAEADDSCGWATNEEYEDNMTDAEADADTLASAGWGTDEDYGYYGGDDGY